MGIGVNNKTLVCVKVLRLTVLIVYIPVTTQLIASLFVVLPWIWDV